MSKPKVVGITRAQMRAAFAEYVRTEGCGCCRDHDGHRRAAGVIGKLLRFPKFTDGSGYNFLAPRKGGRK